MLRLACGRRDVDRGTVVSARALRAVLGRDRRGPAVHPAVRDGAVVLRPSAGGAVHRRTVRARAVRADFVRRDRGGGRSGIPAADHAADGAGAYLGVADRADSAEPSVWILGAVAGGAVARR